MYHYISLIVSIISTVIAALTLLWDVFESKSKKKQTIIKKSYLFDRFNLTINNQVNSKNNEIVHINKDTSIWFLIILFIAYEMFSWNAHLYFLLLYIQALLYVTDNVKCTQQGNDFKFYIILILFLISGFILFFITVNENLLIMSKLAITCISSIWWTLFIKHFTQKLLIPYAARKSDYIFTVSENAKNDIAASYNIKKEKIVVTYDAVNDEFRKLSASELKSEELRSKYNITGDYILSVGNLQPRKNLVRLIKAYKILKKSNKIEEK